MSESTGLRKAIRINAIFTTICVAFLMFGARWLAPHLGLHGVGWLYALATGLALFVIQLVGILRSDRIRQWEIRTIIGADIAWVLGSLFLVVNYFEQLSTVGLLLIDLVAVAVLAFAVMQYRGLKAYESSLAV